MRLCIPGIYLQPRADQRPVEAGIVLWRGFWHGLRRKSAGGTHAGSQKSKLGE